MCGQFVWKKSSFKTGMDEWESVSPGMGFSAKGWWAFWLFAFMLCWAELSYGCLATTQLILYAGIALTEDHWVLQSVDHPANLLFFLQNVAFLFCLNLLKSITTFAYNMNSIIQKQLPLYKRIHFIFIYSTGFKRDHPHLVISKLSKLKDRVIYMNDYL